MLRWFMMGCLFAMPVGAVRADELAVRIDALIDARHREDQTVAAPIADDAEFLRRLSLDLIGRIPTANEVRSFFEDMRADKRALMIDKLLADSQHARHFARVWRSLLLPEAETEPQIRYLQPGLEVWLTERRHANAGFDALVRELLTVPIAGPNDTPEFVLRDIKRPNPLAFMASKDADPAKIASSSIRLFLGLRIECAQCHNHPFEQWTRQQFWNQAAFFAGIERRGRGTFAPLVETVDRRSIKMHDTEEMIPAAYLDKTALATDVNQPARIGFAEWMTARENPYFARAIVNRVWSQLMGTPLSDPVDDFSAANPPCHPVLLDELATTFKSSGYDLTQLMRGICRSAAYQRTSRQTHDSQTRPELFARMAIKPMSPDQFADSLVQAIDHEATNDEERGDMNDDPFRRRVIDLFASDGKSSDPETSVVQALALMNGTVVDRAAKLATSPQLRKTTAAFPDALDRQIEALTLVTLSRCPTETEQLEFMKYCQRGGAEEQARRLGDVFWVLLNSPEFRWNH